MIVKRENDELHIIMKLGNDVEKTQSMLKYLEYQELTAKSQATQEDVDKLLKEVKKGRSGRSKKNIIG